MLQLGIFMFINYICFHIFFCFRITTAGTIEHRLSKLIKTILDSDKRYWFAYKKIAAKTLSSI